MTFATCNFTAACPLPKGSAWHLPGCPAAGDARSLEAQIAHLEPEPAMFPEPQMDYTLSEPQHFDGVPIAFWIGLAAGIALAFLAILAGLLVAIA